MTYYVRPATQPRLHTLTRLENMDPWVAFREACGIDIDAWKRQGFYPHWTRLGDRPELWRAPADAGGSFFLWRSDRSLWAIEPSPGPRSDREQLAADALRDLGAAWEWPSDTHTHRAAYFSSGGRAILLLEPTEPREVWMVAVFRCEDTPRSEGDRWTPIPRPTEEFEGLRSTTRVGRWTCKELTAYNKSLCSYCGHPKNSSTCQRSHP